MISCRDLTRRFGEFTAVDRLTLEVAQGAICVCLGANGAGKSTTMKMLTGQLEITSGVATVCGVSLAGDSMMLRRQIGVLPEDLGLFEDMSVEEHLQLTADVYDIPSEIAWERIEQLISALRLEPARTTFAGRCSHGTRKKTALAMALLPNPRALFLDEPFEAIDPVTSKTMRDLLTAASERGLTIFLTSHILPVAHQIATQFVIIREGRLVFNALAAELPGSLRRFTSNLQKRLRTWIWIGSGVGEAGTCHSSRCLASGAAETRITDQDTGKQHVLRGSCICVYSRCRRFGVSAWLGSVGAGISAKR